MNYIISLYLGLWSSFALNYVDKIPKAKYTLIEEYDFVKYNQNNIAKPNNHTLLPFYKALNNLIQTKAGKVNVVHFGDSHIQADFITDQIRKHFAEDDLLGNGGRGYFFPYKIANSSSAYNIKTTYTGSWSGCHNVHWKKQCSWGLNGMTSTTSSPYATFTIDPNERSKEKYDITKVRVYYDVQDSTSYNIKLMLNGKAVYPQYIDALGYAEFHLKKAQDKITFALEKSHHSQTHFTLQGVSLGNQNAGVQYHATGVNSATVRSFLRNNKMVEHLRSLNPELVVISLGTNDAYTNSFQDKKFKENYALLIRRIKSAVPNAGIIITTPGDCLLHGGWNYSNSIARQRILEVAEELDCAVWDFYTVMGGLGSAKKWQGQSLLSKRDGVHFTAKGYFLQGDLFYDALIKDYTQYCMNKKKGS